MTEPILYEVCACCHLFVDECGEGRWVHLHRGDIHDEALDETHEARPSGQRHQLDWWKDNGPYAMIARFNDKDAYLAQTTTTAKGEAQ